MIDWFTTIAQIVNFLILVFLLRYFLYDRIVAAMDRRQQAIQAEWDEANERSEDAAREREIARTERQELEAKREELMSKVREELEGYRRELTTKVRTEVDELRGRWSESLEQETESFLADLNRRIPQEVMIVARRVLADLASASLERQIVTHFVTELEALEEEQRQNVVESLEEGDRTAIIQTTYPLDDELRRDIENALKATLLDSMEVEFEQSDDLICGIAMHTDAHKLGWNVRDYVITLHEELRQALEEEVARKGTHQTVGMNAER